MNLIKLNDDLGHQRNKEAFRLRKVVVFCLNLKNKLFYLRISKVKYTMQFTKICKQKNTHLFKC